MWKNELRQSLIDAIGTFVDAVAARMVNDRLVGFALVTDDSLETVGGVVVTEAEVAAAGGEDFLYSPTEWAREAPDDVFERANAILRGAAEVCEFSTFVAAAFGILVESIMAVRLAGVLRPDVFLVALSTDPGPRLDELETQAVSRLNTPAIVEGRNRFLAKWS